MRYVCSLMLLSTFLLIGCGEKTPTMPQTLTEEQLREQAEAEKRVQNEESNRPQESPTKSPEQRANEEEMLRDRR
ncbi:MAG: hypothetical protein R3B84_05445 [Zavarzinella sp.]